MKSKIVMEEKAHETIRTFRRKIRAVLSGYVLRMRAIEQCSCIRRLAVGFSFVERYSTLGIRSANDNDNHLLVYVIDMVKS